MSDERSTTKVVPIRHGPFGVISNGRLRSEKYPNSLFAHLAVGALQYTLLLALLALLVYMGTRPA